MTTATPRVLAALIIGVTAFGCGSDSGTDPGPIERAELVAQYEATVFTVTADGAATDLLEAGALVTLTLADDSTTSGRLFVPPFDGMPATDADLTGSWRFDEQLLVVRLDHAADTFLRDTDLELSLVRDRLALFAAESFGGTLIEVLLTNVEPED